MTTINQQQGVTTQVREAVESGVDVSDKIKTITLKALTERQLDKDNIREVVETVSQGISQGISDQGSEAKTLFTQAASALDDALAIATEASKLAIEEAAARVDEYSQHDLDNAAQDLKDIETLFLETLEKAFKSHQLLADISGDFVGHARRSGTAVGKQTLAAWEALTALPHWGKKVLISNTLSTTITLAQIGSGILSGIAQSLKHPSSK